MGDRDAFGREKGEDSLREMGWRASGPASREPAAVTRRDPRADPLPGLAAQAAPAADPATAVFAAGEATAPFLRAKPAEPRTPSRNRRRGPSLAKLLILVAVLGVSAIGVNAAVDAGRDAVDGIRGRISPGASPNAASADSLLRPAALRAALAKLPEGRLEQPLRIAPDRINAQVVSGRTRHIVQIGADGSRIDVKAPVGVRQSALRTVATGAPARIVRAAARMAGRLAADVGYLVLTGDGWVLVFKGGSPAYRATPAGRGVKKIG
ncbi:hypothetical protein [Candidatus Solirubrobacter pratensis]|uniref:hypothetical protein n=1 Tax=Candidatus Solirubrobacter pratensis TaxID=1298857 RepID=UPI0004064400|nr:hypothetical protein [Candidatus Solirubrobacter pratensis]